MAHPNCTYRASYTGPPQKIKSKVGNFSNPKKIWQLIKRSSHIDWCNLVLHLIAVRCPVNCTFANKFKANRLIF